MSFNDLSLMTLLVVALFLPALIPIAEAILIFVVVSPLSLAMTTFRAVFFWEIEAGKFGIIGAGSALVVMGLAVALTNLDGADATSHAAYGLVHACVGASIIVFGLWLKPGHFQVPRD